jgi:putative sterol carrier protein
MQGVILFDVGNQKWTLDLSSGAGSLKQGGDSESADLTLTMTDENFAKLVSGKLNPQQVC